MAATLGMNGEIGYNTTGVGVTSPSFTALTNVTDVTLELSRDDADVTTRGNNGWRARAGTLKDGTINFSMVWDETDAGFTAVKDAWLNGTILGIRALSGSSSAQGLQADMEVISFTRNEPLEEAMTVDVSLAIAFSSTAPTWVSVT